MGRSGLPPIRPIDPKGVPRAKVPYYIEMEPAAVVAAGANVVVRWTVGPRNFVCRGYGFTSSPVGVPAAGQYFKLGIVDIGASMRFQPHRFHATPVIGSNPALGDQSYHEFPHDAEDNPITWEFSTLTTIEIEFENVGAIACLPTLVLVGYLD